MPKSLLAGAALVLALAGCATVSPTSEVARTASLAPPRAAAPGCVGASASRIPMKPDECGEFGQTYNRDEIQRTGQTEVGAMLQMLDPALRVHGH
ncbi:MAG TPA: hypothetical protein VH111_02500 [Steroidobacteraceae bacterium]|nr:hypothetical protein [Steroidobacteraceae bacterium]